MGISLSNSISRQIATVLIGLAGAFALPGYADDTLKAAPVKQVATSAAEELGQVPEGLGLSPGDAVADFAIKTFEGVPTSFNELLEDAPLLVIFYRGGWCPYCNFQVRELTVGYNDFKARGVLPVLISVDRVGGAEEVQKTYEIPFPVLSDPQLAALTEFNVRHEIGEEGYAMMQGHGVDLEDWAGQQHHVIAKSSAFIIDQAGIVKWSHVSDDYKVRPSNKQLLSAIDKLRGDGEI